MAIKKHNPTSAGRRLSSGADFTVLTKKKPEKFLLKRLLKKAGRNNQGKITVRHRGGGAKRNYREVDFLQNKLNVPAKILAIEYDPNRSAYLALIKYKDGPLSYILAAEGMKVGQTLIFSDKEVDIQSGNRTTLEHIPVGSIVHNLEFWPGRGGEIVRSAGSGALIMSVDADFVHVKLSSSEIRKFPKQCRASINQVSNVDWINVRWGKAGRMRYRGLRPKVRGKAMNPVDHPHGGGEGNQPIGMTHPKTAQGKPALGVKTRPRQKESDKYIITRRVK